jgi:hypothetical protein
MFSRAQGGVSALQVVGLSVAGGRAAAAVAPEEEPGEAL